MIKSTVSVIIPSYNRAHLLPKVIPSYFQEYVKEIIIIDDNSTDNTQEIVESLIQKYPIINYYKSEKKIRQTGAKNIGIRMAKGDFCYFGDDDSILKNGSIKSLLTNAFKYPDAIIAARHIYLKNDENIQDTLNDVNITKFNNLKTIYDSKNININLSIRFEKTIEIPFCTYCFLIPISIARSNSFHEGFIKTCFREETDYIMQLCNKGKKVFLDPNALSVDLPRKIVKGGIYDVTFISRHLGEVYNEYLFYKRNKSYLSKISTLNSSPIIRATIHLLNKIYSFFKRY